MSHVSLITLGVAEVGRATAFYEALGWERAPIASDEVAFLRGGTVVLALYGRSALGGDAQMEGATASYATNVGDQAAVDEVLARAMAAGATITRPAFPTDWGGYVGYFTDLDGHLWEVAHNPSFPLGDDGQIFLPGFEEQAAAEMAANEANIASFVAGADSEEGATVRHLADAVVAATEEAARAVAASLAGQSDNVVLATMLELSQRSRQLPPEEPSYWVTSAASTLVNALI